MYKVMVPGSLMLMGEHAVLRNKLALVCAIDKYIYVTLTPRHDCTVNVTSSAHGQLTTSLSDLQITRPFTFVTAAILHMRAKLKFGFDLVIESDFSDQIGFGSSAAVTVATLVALQLCSGCYSEKGSRQLLLAARQVIRKVQGVGSAADAAASIYGGVLAYRVAPLFIKRIASFVPLTVIYSGSKVSTKEVISKVAALRARHTKTFAILDSAIEGCVREGARAIARKNWKVLGEVVNIHQGLQESLGTSNAVLSGMVFALRSVEDNIFGAKISGAGLGDCVIGVGEMQRGGGEKMPVSKNWREIAVKVSAEGVKIIS